jgi:hypothetical protein
MLAGWLANLVSVPIIGAVLSPILNALLTAQKQKLDAVGSHEAVVADLAKREFDIEGQERELQAKMMIAEQGNIITRSIRPLMALPFIIFLWKVIVYDKILGWGTTDALDPKMWGVFMIVVGAYMGGRVIETGTSKIADAIVRSRK